MSLAAAGLVGLLVGCGSRTAAPQLIRPAAPGGLRPAEYREVGFRLATPRNWTTVTVHLPLVALVTSGGAVISLWRYSTSGPAPRTPAELRQTSRRLITAARRRDPELRVVQSGLAPAGGYPAVELETDQRIGTEQRRVYSTHVFASGEEVVLEEYAPPDLFGALDTSIFSAVRRSLTPLRR